jgi:RHS repeat-associated protein
VHGPGIDEPLAIEQQGKVYFYHADGLGSITSLTDAKGRVVQSCEYDSFGSVRQHGNHVKQPYGFTAREWDSETGLYFYRARYYDPQVGRFISKDPIGFNGGDVVLYGYVQNNPVNWGDPWGLDRYNMCKEIPSLLERCCKKIVDWGCSGTKNTACCESEKTECLGNVDFAADSDAETKALECSRAYSLCNSRTRTPKTPPVKPIPYPTTPKPNAPGFPKITEK